MIPIWLLDVDGVINAYDETMPVVGDWGDWETFTAQHRFTIRYSPEMIRRIRTLHDSGVVEVQWLTTWGSKANTDLIGLGMPALQVAAEMPFRATYGWWKLPVAQKLFSEGRVVIWTDDDIVYDTPAMYWINEVATSDRHNDLYAFAPKGAISQLEMKNIEAWLEKR